MRYPFPSKGTFLGAVKNEKALKAEEKREKKGTNTKLTWRIIAQQDTSKSIPFNQN